MTIEIEVDGSHFLFSDEWTVSKLDEWSSHVRAASSVISAKACDLLAVSDSAIWLIEAKDYSYAGAAVPKSLPDDMNLKLWHSLALIHSQARWGDGEEQKISQRAIAARDLGFALSIELPTRGRPDLTIPKALAGIMSNLKPKMRAQGMKFKPVISNSFVNASSSLPWTVRRNPAKRSFHTDR